MLCVGMDDEELVNRLRSAAPKDDIRRDFGDVSRRARRLSRRRRQVTGASVGVLLVGVLSIAAFDRTASNGVAVGAAGADTSVNRTTGQGLRLSYRQASDDASVLSIEFEDARFTGSSTEAPLASAAGQPALHPADGPSITGATLSIDPRDPGGRGLAVVTVYVSTSALSDVAIALDGSTIEDSVDVSSPGAIVLAVALDDPTWRQQTPALTLLWAGPNGRKTFAFRPRLDLLHDCTAESGRVDAPTASTVPSADPGAIPPSIDAACS